MCCNLFVRARPLNSKVFEYDYINIHGFVCLLITIAPQHEFVSQANNKLSFAEFETGRDVCVFVYVGN